MAPVGVPALMVTPTRDLGMAGASEDDLACDPHIDIRAGGALFDAAFARGRRVELEGANHETLLSSHAVVDRLIDEIASLLKRADD